MRGPPYSTAAGVSLQAPALLIRPCMTKREPVLEDSNEETEERCVERADVAMKVEATHREVPKR